MTLRHCVIACALVIICGGSAFAEDRNLTTEGNTLPVPATPPDGGNVVLTFPGPLNGFQIDLHIVNGTSGDLSTVTLDGTTTAPFHILWDDPGIFSGPATLTNTVGVDTEILTFSFSGFNAGETVQFTGMDPDFNGGDPSVPVSGLAGVMALIAGDAGSGAGLFTIVDQNVVAVVQLGATPVESTTWGRIKSQFD